jgi:hypothetical protein
LSILALRQACQSYRIFLKQEAFRHFPNSRIYRWANGYVRRQHVAPPKRRQLEDTQAGIAQNSPQGATKVGCWPDRRPAGDANG